MLAIKQVRDFFQSIACYNVVRDVKMKFNVFELQNIYRSYSLLNKSSSP
jgi:hypothetical protein